MGMPITMIFGKYMAFSKPAHNLDKEEFDVFAISSNPLLRDIIEFDIA